MARVVVVATSEIDRETLGDVVAPADELVVVVPAVEQSRLQWLASDEDEARAHADEVGQAIARAAPAESVRVDVKADDPNRVVLDAIAEHRPDRIVLALREDEDASWLEEGELAGAPPEVAGVPITRVSL